MNSGPSSRVLAAAGWALAAIIILLQMFCWHMLHELRLTASVALDPLDPADRPAPAPLHGAGAAAADGAEPVVPHAAAAQAH